MKNKKLTDTFIITKKFQTAAEFSLFIDEQVANKKCGYMEAVLDYCEKIELDIGSISPLINKKLKEKIQLEAEGYNMMKPTGRLPL